MHQARGSFQRHTNIDASQPRQVQSRANDIRSPFGEDDMPAIVAFLHSFQDILRVVRFEIVVALDNAFLGPFRRSVHLLIRTLR